MLNCPSIFFCIKQINRQGYRQMNRTSGRKRDREKENQPDINIEFHIHVVKPMHDIID